jgi:TetR/AcrR family transcriptional regulator, fatty acid metabolism regulator protein
MARERDEAKRQAILAAAKRLFAERGFHGTSVSDLASAVDLPIGSIYTYFESKEAIVATVVEEGWESFFSALAAAASGPGRPEERLALVVYRFMPELFADIDLISIILAEAGRSISLEDKLERLASLVSGLVSELASARGLVMDFPPRLAKAAIMIYFLGSLDAVRIGKLAGIEVEPKDAIDFIKLSVENSFCVELKRPPA